MIFSSIEITRKLYDFEERHELLLKSTDDGVFFWVLVREELAMKIWANKGLIGESSGIPFHSFGIIRKISLLWDLCVNEIHFRVFMKPKKVAIISLGRNLNSENLPVDLMLEDYISTFKGQCNIFETYNNKQFRRDPNRYKDRYFNYMLELKKQLFPFDSKKVKEDFSQLSSLINKEFDMQYDWNMLIKRFVYDYRINYKWYKKIFSKWDSRFLLYTIMIRPAVAAANDMGIHTIEVLHGCPSPSTLTWNLGKDSRTEKINCLPRFLCTHSQYWDKFISGPFKKINTGNNFFYSPALPYKKATKNITVISSTYTFQDIIQLAYKTAALLGEYHFYIKLQSSEIDHIKVVEKMFSKLKNYTIIFNEYNVNELFDRSDYVMLVQSSCTYQALQKGLGVFVYKRLYYHESEDVFDLPQVHLVEDENEVAAIVEQTSNYALNSPVSRFFDPYNKNVVEGLLNRNE